ncbi:Zn-dependent hydrolase of beta-lactamase fold family [Cellulomonas flavigena DSM 20109]|uniref:Zn-dependent hydrolase of beta-lactamase fold family n=1 Tax=Cellulomonas flavigena (strain ATCC 482 / DSM 20109 / BCRC 11376 / JCM 18109 / NBRC 3775 / NCIMB 8073 / NRS 134) TaxID=446466 RepID=D5UEW8_CELFN|nr:MBL fold metallo-hydrolase [Cellulomonas flavigena]ADG74778.1 Zn-dependent hydrolase of beta-lactamase fold family [Cellulomonas flavigena DSM 20109]
MALTLTRLGHSCVRVETALGAFTIDPGSFSDVPAALAGVRDVLVTHVHPDHVDVAAVAAVDDVTVHAPAQVLDALREAGARTERLHAVAAGDRLDLAGVHVEVLGELHEAIHPDVPRPANVAYLLDGTVLHPGDSYTRPPSGTSVDVLLEPVGAPWLRLGDVVDHVRAVAPRRVVPVHDALLSDLGRASAVRFLTQLTQAEVVTLDVGRVLEVD